MRVYVSADINGHDKSRPRGGESGNLFIARHSFLFFVGSKRSLEEGEHRERTFREAAVNHGQPRARDDGRAALDSLA